MQRRRGLPSFTLLASSTDILVLYSLCLAYEIKSRCAVPVVPLKRL